MLTSNKKIHKVVKITIQNADIFPFFGLSNTLRQKRQAFLINLKLSDEFSLNVLGRNFEYKPSNFDLKISILCSDFDYLSEVSHQMSTKNECFIYV